ncbi:MAG: hypothetical protein MUC87_04940 [Bacteroidia bacterium]|jgi:tetratricopeptide (TPR) repeat protein|nr:hypothetical protein [Bacteroidia bacterium]
MFGLFSKKRKYSHLNEQLRLEIENQLLWFIACYGMGPLKEEPFVFAHDTGFLFHISSNLAKEYSKIGKRCRVDVAQTALYIFDDIDTRTWEKWEFKTDSEGEPFFEQTGDTNTDLYRIDIFRSTLKDPYWSIFILAHQLSAFSLISKKFLEQKSPDFISYNDAAVIYFGYSIFAANCVDKPAPQEWKLTQEGYYFDKVIYATGIMCLITNTEYKTLLPHLSDRAALNLRHEAELLIKFGETNVNRKEIEKCESQARLINLYNEYTKEHEFEKVFEVVQKMLEIFPDDCNLTNNAGYALLMLKKYEEAIPWFNRSAEKDPYFDYPFNNRGYAYLMLGNFSQAKTDIYTAFELNNDNSFVWRNKAVYSMTQGNFEHVLEWLAKARQLDKHTELIHFYTSIAHRNLGNMQEAEYHQKLSEELKEFNDSVFHFHTIFERQN